MNKSVCWLVHEAKTRRHEGLPKPVPQNRVGGEDVGRCCGVDRQLPLGECARMPA